MKPSLLKKVVLYSILATSIAIGGFFGFKRFDKMKRENAVKNSSLYSYVMTKKPLEEERYKIVGEYEGIGCVTQIVIVDTAGAREYIFECFEKNLDDLLTFETLKTDRARDSLILNVVAKELEKKHTIPSNDVLDELHYTTPTLRPRDIYGKPNACYTLCVAVAGVAAALGVPSELLTIDNPDPSRPYHSVLALGGECSGLVVDNAGPEYGQPFVLDIEKFINWDYWGRGLRNGTYTIRSEEKIKINK
ncbi:MAG: hypothetical protein QXL47_00370 [Candidatus Anstonellales archaeon]